ncbi:MAG: hypothetical protein OHK0036_05700 [Bacteroidia bacterium]
MLRYWNVIIVFCLFFLIACNQSENPSDYPNTPTSGKIKIAVDWTFQYILPPQFNLFSSTYKNTELQYYFKDEPYCINDLLNDSCKVIFLSRKLSAVEEKIFVDKNIILHQTPIAITGIALIGYPFREKGIVKDTLIDILKGKKSQYKIVFYGKQNGAVLYCKDSLLNGEKFGENCFMLNDTNAFRQFLFEHHNAIGILDFSMICDDDDKWTSSIKYPHQDTLIIPVRANINKPAYYPDQSNIATGDYIFRRFIYCIRRGDNFSLSAGIEAFVAGEKGQILFKKMGLVPVFDRERRIQINPY